MTTTKRQDDENMAGLRPPSTALWARGAVGVAAITPARRCASAPGWLVNRMGGAVGGDGGLKLPADGDLNPLGGFRWEFRKI